MDGLIERLCGNVPILADGAWGTRLQELGMAFGECPDLWNLTHPDRVAAVAREYVEAGSQVILTNTFGANRAALERHGLASEADRICRAGAEISREAAGEQAAVFGSIGPTRKSVYKCEISHKEAMTAFDEQASALAPHVDALIIETMTDIHEATIAVRAAAATGLPVIACTFFGAATEGTVTGVGIERAVDELIAAGAIAVGSNCGDVRETLDVCRRMQAYTAVPIWMKPSAGLPVLEGGRAVYKMIPGDFANGALALVEAGADFIGGCCGTTPAHIKATKNLLRSADIGQNARSSSSISRSTL